MDNLRRSRLNYFADHTFDRFAENRRNQQWVETTLTQPSTYFLPLWRSRHLFGNDFSTVFCSYEELQLWATPETTILLGGDGENVYFSVDLPPGDDSMEQHFQAKGKFQTLRAAGTSLPPLESGLHAYARALAYWHKRHQFCGKCGSANRFMDAGHQRICSNPECQEPHFPRTDPCVIAIVTYGDQCLLGRQASWPPGRYSALAGFVEPGESIEQAVIREVQEEAGVPVHKVMYQSSQPWPFPCSLMLGFRAEASSQEIHLHDQELEDAKWFTRKEIADGLKSGELGTASSFSISFKLLEDWFDEESEIPLQTILQEVKNKE